MVQFLKDKHSKEKTEDTSEIILEEETLLLILDLQEKLISNIKGNQLLIFNIKKLIESSNLLNVRIAILLLTVAILAKMTADVEPRAVSANTKILN